MWAAHPRIKTHYIQSLSPRRLVWLLERLRLRPNIDTKFLL